MHIQLSKEIRRTGEIQQKSDQLWDGGWLQTEMSALMEKLC